MSFEVARLQMCIKNGNDLIAKIKFYICTKAINMKTLLTAFFAFYSFAIYAQTVPAQQPVEERYHISYWWWVLGVLLAIGIGVLVYILIKKDPKRDAVR
jgi:hypothetical protein